MKIIIEGEAKEIAALVLAAQERQGMFAGVDFGSEPILTSMQAVVDTFNQARTKARSL